VNYVHTIEGAFHAGHEVLEEVYGDRVDRWKIFPDRDAEEEL
jgi:hypothetical protein